MKLAAAQDGIISKQDVADLLKVSAAQAYSVIKKLQQEGKLELLYGGKYAKYKIVQNG